MTMLHNPMSPELPTEQTHRSVRALERASRSANLMRAMNLLYWIAILSTLGYVFSLAIDRAPPIVDAHREIVNPGQQVRQGERLLIKGRRTRVRECEVTRRWSIIDGIGRRHNFEPEHFDAYDRLGLNEDIDGPVIPLDAAPGRGRFLSVNAYDCNPLQRATGWSIVVVPPALEFEILPRSG